MKRDSLWAARRPFDPAKCPVFYGWVILAIANLSIFACALGQPVGISVFADGFIENARLTRTQLTLAFLLGTGLSGLLLPIISRSIDRFGARASGMLAAFAMGLMLMLMGQVGWLVPAANHLFLGDQWHGLVIMTGGFLVLRLAGQGMLATGARAMLARWWNRKRGLIVSINSVVVGALFFAMPAFLLWEAQAVGWRGAWLMNGSILALVMPLLIYLLYRETPESCGLEMDGAFAREIFAEPRNDDLLLRKDFTQSEAVRTYAFWIIALMMALQSLFGTAYAFHVLDLGRSYGVPEREFVGYYVKAIPLIMVACLISGWSLEYIRIRLVMVALGLAGVLKAVGLLLLPSPAGSWTLIAGLGVAGGAMPVVSGVIFARYFGRAHLGAITGTATSFVIGGSALGPLFFSLSKDYFDDYTPAVRTVALFSAVLSVLALFVSNPQRKIPRAKDPESS